MSVLSELGAAEVIRVVANEIKRALTANEKKPLEVSVALKKIGRFCLAELEGSLPDWTQEFRELFKE